MSSLSSGTNSARTRSTPRLYNSFASHGVLASAIVPAQHATWAARPVTTGGCGSAVLCLCTDIPCPPPPPPPSTPRAPFSSSSPIARMAALGGLGAEVDAAAMAIEDALCLVAWTRAAARSVRCMPHTTPCAQNGRGISCPTTGAQCAAPAQPGQRVHCRTLNAVRWLLLLCERDPSSDLASPRSANQ